MKESQSDIPEDKNMENIFTLISKKYSTKLEALEILDASEFVIHQLNSKFKKFKIYDSEKDKYYRFLVGNKNTILDYNEIIEKAKQSDFKKYGRLQKELYRQISIDNDRNIPVLIKFVVKEKTLDKSSVIDDSSHKKFVTEIQLEERRITEETMELYQKIFSEYDLKRPEEFSQSGPFVSTSLPRSIIHKLSRDERISFIGLDREKRVKDYPTIDESLPTTLTDYIQNLGVRGKGVKIAVLEDGGLWKDEDFFNIDEIQDDAQAADSHMTRSVGIIGNRYDDGEISDKWLGYAPEASVLIANDGDYKDAYEWAKSKNVNVITMSWHYTSEETSGDLHSRDIYFDYMVAHYPYPTIFVSAGNQADEDAYASGKGYNFFGVGDVVNDGDGNRCCDTIKAASSWINPDTIHNDREIPEISAPGSRHDLLGSSFGGTSCATPVSASISTLLMNHNNSLLIWPEAIRAILLATANYQKADNVNWSTGSDGKDGTGMINTKYAYWTAGRRETGECPQFRAHDYGTMYASDFNGYYKKKWKIQVYNTDSHVRVALTWNSKTSSSDGEPTTSILNADLDLYVYDPDGNLVAYSISWDGNYEFVEFVPKKMGVYTIKIYGFSVPNDFWSWYGIAWTLHYDKCLFKLVKGVFLDTQLVRVAEVPRAARYQYT